MTKIRVATESDFEFIWPIFQEVVSAGDTYACERDTSREDAFNIWMRSPRLTCVVEEEGDVPRGKGLATSMCEHSQRVAIELGYKAMQFNFVAASNEGAIRLWNKLGFDTVGRLPKAFDHPDRGYVDALIMFKWLD